MTYPATTGIGQFWRPSLPRLRYYVSRQVPDLQNRCMLIHAFSDFTLMLKLLHTNVAHLVGFLWFILHLDVSSPEESEPGVVVTL